MWVTPCCSGCAVVGRDIGFDSGVIGFSVALSGLSSLMGRVPGVYTPGYYLPPRWGLGGYRLDYRIGTSIPDSDGGPHAYADVGMAPRRDARWVLRAFVLLAAGALKWTWGVAPGMWVGCLGNRVLARLHETVSQASWVQCTRLALYLHSARAAFFPKFFFPEKTRVKRGFRPVSRGR